MMQTREMRKTDLGIPVRDTVSGRPAQNSDLTTPS